MRKTVQTNNQLRLKRAQRNRKRLRGTAQKPRLCVIKTNKHIHAQLIDDEAGHTLGSASTQSKELKGTDIGGRNKEAAKKLGEIIGSIAKDKNIKEVIFDRGPFKYHGILAELADAARAAGLQF